MPSLLRQVRYPVELGLLLAFAFFLPLLEFWKNVALVGYYVAWCVNRARARDFGGPWRASDTVVALWIAAAYLSAAFAGLDPGLALRKTGDVAVSALLFWMVSRSGYGAREVRAVFGVLVLSAIVGVAVGVARLVTGAARSGTLQLYSVGHVNHSAIYLAIMLGLAASWVFARWPGWATGRRAVGLLCAALLFVALLAGASRAAVGMGGVVLVLLGLVWWPRWRAPLAAIGAALAVAAAVAGGFGAEVIQKQMANAEAGNVLSARDGIWRTALEAWRHEPWFGVGKTNFGLVDEPRLRGWVEASGRTFEAGRYFYSSHAHSLYANTLAERGGVGFATLLLVLGASLAALLRGRPRPADPAIAWTAWGGAAAAWLVTAGVGAVNTTLHHEHGLLAALLLALWLTIRHPRSAS